MKIGAKVTLFNAKMRELRRECGITQVELAKRIGTYVSKIADIELLRKVDGDYEEVYNLLWNIADCLGVSIDEIFPPEYLYALQEGYLPKERKLVLFSEVDIERLPSGRVLERMLPENITDYRMFQEEIRDMLDNLPGPERNKEILKDLYGFTTGTPMTIEEVAKRHNLTSRERVRQIREELFSKLRHPGRKRHLRDYLDLDWDSVE
jgi:transcriptional regulator with XRE-family HTH domain